MADLRAEMRRLFVLKGNGDILGAVTIGNQAGDGVVQEAVEDGPG